MIILKDRALFEGEFGLKFLRAKRLKTRLMQKKFIPDYHVRKKFLFQNIAHPPFPSKNYGPLLERDIYHSQLMVSMG